MAVFLASWLHLQRIKCFELDKLIKMLQWFIVFFPIGRQSKPFVLWLVATDLQYSPSSSIVKLTLLTDGQHKANRWRLSGLAGSLDILRGTHSSHNPCLKHKNLFCVSKMPIKSKRQSLLCCCQTFEDKLSILANGAVS